MKLSESQCKMTELCKGKTRDRHFPYPSSPCNNAAWKDGFCKLHHPDEKLKRIKERMKKKEKEEGMNSHFEEIRILNATLQEKKNEISRLTAELAECDKWKERVQVRDDHIDALKSEITALKERIKEWKVPFSVWELARAEAERRGYIRIGERWIPRHE